MKRKTKTLFIIYFMWAVPSFAQSTYFSKFYAKSNAIENGNTVVQLSGGNYLSASALYDYKNNFFEHIYLIKTDTKGDTIWTRLLSNDSIGLEPICLREFQSNKYIIGGNAWTNDGNNSGYFNMLIDTSGNVSWIKIESDSFYKYQTLWSILVDSNEKIIDVGLSSDAFHATISKATIVKMDSNGNLIWKNFYGGGTGTFTQGRDIIETNHQYIVAALTTLGDGNLNYNGYVFLTDSSGKLIWQKIYGDSGKDDALNFITKSNDNNYIVGSTTQSFQSSNIFTYRAWLLKIDSSGGIIWNKTFGADTLGEGYFQKGKNSNDGSLILIGGESGLKDKRLHPFVMKVSQNGDSIWKQAYHFPNDSFDNYFYDFQQTLDSGYIISGTCHPHTQSVWLLKVDQFGCDSVGCNEATGIEPVAKSNFNSVLIYPNPVHTTFSISYHLPQNNSGDVEIFNLLGQRIYSATLSPWSSIHEINAGKWANGIYEVKISSPNQYATLKIVKE